MNIDQLVMRQHLEQLQMSQQQEIINLIIFPIDSMDLVLSNEQQKWSKLIISHIRIELLQ
jgi:hypothetical protein